MIPVFLDSARKHKNLARTYKNWLPDEKDNISQSASNKIAWDSMGEGFDSLPLELQRIIRKNLSHFCGVNKTRQQWQKLNHAECP
jgi:hypothetical protein